VEEAERLDPVRRKLDVVAFQAERAPERLAQRSVVVHYENSQRGPSLGVGPAHSQSRAPVNPA